MTTPTCTKPNTACASPACLVENRCLFGAKSDVQVFDIGELRGRLNRLVAGRRGENDLRVGPNMLVSACEDAEAALSSLEKERDEARMGTIARIAEVASAVGFQAAEPAQDIAGMIVSHLAIHPEHVARFMAEGAELLIDGTIRPETGSLSYRSVAGAILSPTTLRAKRGTQQ